MAVPAMYSKLIEHIDGKKMNFDHIRLLTSGSAPLLPSDFERIRKTFGKEPVEREGMSETGMNFSNPINGTRKSGSIGIPLPNVQVRVVDPINGTDVDPGQTGEFWLKGDSITHGYWRKIEETKKAFEDGWFKTGDLGYVDVDGYYFLTDRLKHIIISGGENVSPKEVEMILNRVPGVLESSVVGIQDAKWGERIVAAVVPTNENNLDKNELKEFCKKHLHDWKCPKEFSIVDKIPRNTMGKVLKEKVKELFEHSL
jgi:malonyl-CoA/methylmalonyl-CoA synthetase